jgi:hypothetical protein
MRRTVVLRLTTFALAIVHAFPACKHLLAFFHGPSLDEAWKGFGAVLAIALYLLPVRVQATALRALWHNHRWLVRVFGTLLAVVHAVPAFDHLPRLIESVTWADAWRGFGSATAVIWFLAPVRVQGRVIIALARLARLRAPGLGAGPESRAEAVPG